MPSVPLKVGDIVDRKGSRVVTISENANLKAVANVMRDNHVAALVVLRAHEVVGVVSERDIVVALAQYGQSAGTTWLAGVLSRRLVAISGSDTIRRAMSLMTRERMRHLPVINDGALKSIISLGDIVKYYLEELEAETYVLRELAIGFGVPIEQGGGDVDE